MVGFLQSLHPVTQALLATCFTWAVTAFGAAVVFVVTETGRKVLDGMLGFAGAMIFVVVEEVIPESQRGGNTDLATMNAMTGFTAMMVLDVAFG